MKTARQQHNQDISAFLCVIRIRVRRAYQASSQLVEQISLTNFIEGLSDSTLRWELRRSKPATADDALALAMDLVSSLEIEKRALSTSKMADTSVNAICRKAPEPSTKEWMDEFVRTKKSTGSGIVRQITTSLLNPTALIPVEPEWSVSKTIRMEEVITTTQTTIGEDPTAKIGPLTGPKASKAVPKDSANIVDGKAHLKRMQSVFQVQTDWTLPQWVLRIENPNNLN